MVSWAQLFLPALVAAVAVFFASSVIHMVLKLHNKDYKGIPNEDEVRGALRKGGITPGQYMIPHCQEAKAHSDPAMLKKFEEGPIGVLYVGSPGTIKMGPFLGKWFTYTIVLGLVAGYVAKSALLPGASFGHVLQVVGAAAWLGYSFQSPSDSIWKSKPWAVTFRSFFDGLIYAVLTGLCFALMWPKG